MDKLLKSLKIFLLILYIILIFFLMFRNEKITLSYDLPGWLIPSLFFINVIYFCYQYINLKLKENTLEKEIISIISHTFRTPLTSILWYLKELEKNPPQNEKDLFLQNINNRTSKILSIIDILVGIKDLKNTSSYYFQATSIREIFEESVKIHREQINKKNLIFQISSFKNIPLLTIDLKRISFVFDTIIENAIYYTNKNGKILIDCIPLSDKLILFISDNGIGLNLIDKIKIFSKFYRGGKAKLLNTDGLGLRLYLSKIIIKKHRGKIYVKSNGQNEGATFFIELPYIK